MIKRDNFSLLDFPILQCWPQDGGRFITLPCVMTRDPRTGKRNIGMYRMHVYDATSTGMHWQRHKNAAEHQRELMRAAVANGPTLGKTSSVDIMARSGGGSIAIQGKPVSGRMEVAVAIGTDPALTFSAIVPAPPEIEEYMIAGFLRGKPMEVVKCETVDLEVPANAEIVLEGYIDIGEMKVEGPFGDHTGFYSLEDLYPVFHVQCITHRKNPIYAATIVGKPPQEDAWMALAVARIFLPAAKMMIPELVDFHLPPEGVAHNLMIHLDSQIVSGTGAQGDECDLVAGAGDVHQMHCGGGRGLRREGSARGYTARAQQHRSRARYSVHAGAGGYAGPRFATAELRQQDGD